MIDLENMKKEKWIKNNKYIRIKYQFAIAENYMICYYFIAKNSV